MKFFITLLAIAAAAWFVYPVFVEWAIMDICNDPPPGVVLKGCP